MPIVPARAVTKESFIQRFRTTQWITSNDPTRTARNKSFIQRLGTIQYTMTNVPARTVRKKVIYTAA